MRISDWSSDVCSSDLVERAFKGFKEYLQRIRRNVQIQGHFHDRLAIDHGEWQLLLSAVLAVGTLNGGFHCGHSGLDQKRGRITATDTQHLRLAIGQVEHRGRLHPAKPPEPDPVDL